MTHWELIATALFWSAAVLLWLRWLTQITAAGIKSNHNHLSAQHQQLERLQTCLPQTQCKQCGYAGCLPYAEAILNNEVDIDRCPPGGIVTKIALARILGRSASLTPAELSTKTTGHVPIRHTELRPKPSVAWIDESRCIGCAKCVIACPMDAIVGAAKQMHTVISSECTGCGLCLPPCPTDCIVMRETNALAPC